MGKLTAQFVTKRSETYVIEIASDTIPSGTLELSKDPLHLVMPQADDKYPGVRTIEAEINVLTKESLSYLYSDDPLHTNVTIKKNGTTIFYGFLEPSTWAQPITPGVWNECQIVAMDILAAVKNVPYQKRDLVRVTEDTYGTTSLIGDLKALVGDVTLQYHTDVDTKMLDGYFSTEAFIGTDLDDTDAYTTLGDMLSGYCRAMGLTMMAENRTLHVYKVDSENTNTTDLKGKMASDSLDMEVVAPVRKVKGSWDPEPSFEDSKWKRGDLRVNLQKLKDCNAVLGLMLSEDSGTYIQAAEEDYNYQTAKTMQHNIWNGKLKPSVFTGDLGSKNDNISSYVGGCAVSKENRVHIRVPYTRNQYVLECDTHLNEAYPAYMTVLNGKAWATMYPDVEICNTRNNCTDLVRLCFTDDPVTNGSDTIQATYGEPEGYEADANPWDSKWVHVMYKFPVSNEKILTKHGKMRLWVKSNQYRLDGIDYWISGFAKGFTLQTSENEDLKIEVKACGALTMDEMDFGTPLVTANALTSESSVGLIGIDWSYGAPNTKNAMQTIAKQYSLPREQVSGDFEDTIMSGLSDVTHHLTFKGKKYTLMAMDWSVRDNSINLKILEDYNQ